MAFTFIPADPREKESIELLNRLSDTLAAITGDSGRSSFGVSDLDVERALFVLAKDGNLAVGCGAIRPFNDDNAELKRMFAPPIKGAELLAYLEKAAFDLGYLRIVLSTRLVNERAVRFYRKHSYEVTENYGRYHERPESVCMAKCIG